MTAATTQGNRVQARVDEAFGPGGIGRMLVLEAVDQLVPELTTDESRAELAQLRRRHHAPQTFAEEVEWWREFGSETISRFEGSPRQAAAFFREERKLMARRYGLPYGEVASALEQAMVEGVATA